MWAQAPTLWRLVIVPILWYIAVKQCQKNSHLNEQMIQGGRQTKFLMLKNNQSKIGMNSLVNKFYVLNNKIELSHFNQTMNCYKKAINYFFNFWKEMRKEGKSSIGPWMKYERASHNSICSYTNGRCSVFNLSSLFLCTGLSINFVSVCLI